MTTVHRLKKSQLDANLLTELSSRKFNFYCIMIPILLELLQ